MSEFNDFVKRLIIGANDVFFRDVIEASAKTKVMPINSQLHKELLVVKKKLETDLKKISMIVKTRYRGRANELSNYMENIVLEEINSIPHFKAAKPTVESGKKQSAGYPDLLVDVGSLKFYLEVKTFQLKTSDSSLRTFYYKPSEKSKVMVSCPHVLISFEAESLGQENKSPFLINNFKLIDLYDLRVNLKPEFNASNVELYACSQI